MKPHDEDENLKDGAAFEPFTIKEVSNTKWTLSDK